VSIIDTVMKNLYNKDLDTMVEALHTNMTVSNTSRLSYSSTCFFIQFEVC
jgi:hypothetical protein